MVWKLDRLGRSLQHLISIVTDLHARGVEFRSLTEQIDTTTPMGKFTFHVMAAMAQFERELIRERTLEGLKVARAKGHRPGPKPKFVGRRLKVARGLLTDGQTVTDVAQTLGVSRSTLYRALEREKAPA